MTSAAKASSKGSHQPRNDNRLSETIFLRNRQTVANAVERHSALIDHIEAIPSRDEIQSAHLKDDVIALFDQIDTLSHQLENSYITLSYQGIIDSRLSLLREKEFFCIKTLVGIEASAKDIKGSIFLDSEIRRKHLMMKAASTIKEAFALSCQSAEDKRKFIQDLLAELDGSDEDRVQKEIASEVNEFWVAKRGRPSNSAPRETPIEFIQRVYKRWIDTNELRRNHLNHDPALSKAYANWIWLHPDEDLQLATNRAPKSDAESLNARELAEHRKGLVRENNQRFQNRRITLPQFK